MPLISLYDIFSSRILTDRGLSYTGDWNTLCGFLSHKLITLPSQGAQWMLSLLPVMAPICSRQWRAHQWIFQCVCVYLCACAQHSGGLREQSCIRTVQIIPYQECANKIVLSFYMLKKKQLKKGNKQKTPHQSCRNLLHISIYKWWLTARPIIYLPVLSERGHSDFCILPIDFIDPYSLFSHPNFGPVNLILGGSQRRILIQNTSKQLFGTHFSD